MSLNNMKHVALDHKGEIALLETYDKEINRNEYKQVWRISKSSPEAQLSSMLQILLSITRHEDFDRESLMMLAKLSELEDRIDLPTLRKVLPDHSITVHNILNDWAAERDFRQYRLGGTGKTPIEAIVNMKRIGFAT